MGKAVAVVAPYLPLVISFFCLIAAWRFGDFSMFLGLRLHDTKPLWAWIFCLVTTVFLIIYFHIPISTMK